MSKWGVFWRFTVSHLHVFWLLSILLTKTLYPKKIGFKQNMLKSFLRWCIAHPFTGCRHSSQAHMPKKSVWHDTGDAKKTFQTVPNKLNESRWILLPLQTDGWTNAEMGRMHAKNDRFSTSECKTSTCSHCETTPNPFVTLVLPWDKAFEFVLGPPKYIV